MIEQRNSSVRNSNDIDPSQSKNLVIDKTLYESIDKINLKINQLFSQNKILSLIQGSTRQSPRKKKKDDPKYN